MRESRPSATALLIVQAMAFQARDPALAGLIPPEAAALWERFLAAADPARALLVRRLAGQGWARALAHLGERLVIPGVRLHYAVRKLYLEAAVRRALAEGVTQVAVLGAGLDPLALRLHREFPEVLFVECDHPATQGVKRRALAEEPAGSNLRLVELDLGKAGVAEVVPALPGWRPGADTLLLAEGLTMYLQAAEVDALFAFLRGHAGAGSRFAFTFMEPRRDGTVDFAGSTPLVRPWLRLVGEPFTWGVRREELPGFLEGRGFSLREVAGADLLRQRHLAPAGLAGRRLAVGEYVAVAERMVPAP